MLWISGHIWPSHRYHNDMPVISYLRLVPTWWATSRKCGSKLACLAGSTPDRIASFAYKSVGAMFVPQFPIECGWWWTAGNLRLWYYIGPGAKNKKCGRSCSLLTNTSLVAAPVSFLFSFLHLFSDLSCTPPCFVYSSLALSWVSGHFSSWLTFLLYIWSSFGQDVVYPYSRELLYFSENFFTSSHIYYVFRIFIINCHFQTYRPISDKENTVIIWNSTSLMLLPEKIKWLIYFAGIWRV